MHCQVISRPSRLFLLSDSSQTVILLACLFRGTGSRVYLGSGSNGDNYLDIEIDYRGFGYRGNRDIFSCITAVYNSGGNGTTHCVRCENGDDFLSPCSSLILLRIQSPVDLT